LEGLAAGDDLHGRTTTATFMLREALAARIGDDPAFIEIQAHIDNSPLFFLNLWMAACKCMLNAADGVAGSTLVTTMAGNGKTFGLQIAGLPGTWFTADAQSPRGPLADPRMTATPSGAIGDSAIVDALGFGGQAVSFAPDVVAMLGNYLPRGAADYPEKLLCAPHPAFEPLGLLVGLDARRVVECGISPIVTLAMIDAGGRLGLLGRGTYRPPLGLFEAACAQVASAAT
jgi:hypothetical protein